MKINFEKIPSYTNFKLNKNIHSIPCFKGIKKDVFYSSKKHDKSEENLFFVRMKTYKKDRDWADKMSSLTNQTCAMIKADDDFCEILNFIRNGIHKIRGSQYGENRTKLTMDGMFFIYSGKRGGEYYKLYKNLVLENGAIIPKSNEEYINANCCKILYNKNYSAVQILYGSREDRSGNIDLAKKEFEKLRKIKNPPQEQINKSAATIYWLIIQECPYKRGNDSIAGTLIRALYKSYDIQLTPLKRKCSLDFEAFYRNLDEYIKCFPSFFK